VEIIGHTDVTGHEAFNSDLSTRRAKAAYAQILAGGVPASEKISYKASGRMISCLTTICPKAGN
jgi:outer membrane protein OmpA-like peptidoglycan-associated protein